MKMIVALDLARTIGREDGSIPWRLKGDLKRFKSLTMGGKIIVGRVTAQKLPPLPGRTVIIATGGNLPVLCIEHLDAWIAGGAAIYQAALGFDLVTEIHATRVYVDHPQMGDVRAPFWESKFALRSVELGADPNTVYETWVRAPHES